MIDYNNLQDLLKEKTGLAYFNASKDELICRCPICEKDARKNHGHLYIKIPDHPNELPVYNCFKTDDCKGTLIKLLRILGEDPKDYISEDMLKFRPAGKEYSYYKKSFRKNKFIIPDIQTDKYMIKRQYLKGRLGFDTDIDKIPGLILNIRKFIMDNNIDLGNRQRFLEFYENNYVGFISNNGSILVLRNTDSSSSFRYVKINLSNNNFFKDMYSIQTCVTRSDTNTIVLCEGIFDLLVAINSHELQDLKMNSCIWAAVLGCNYYNIVPSVLDQCRLTAANFIILSDNDKKESDYIYFKRNPSVLNLKIYRNKYGEDFGKLPIALSQTNFTYGKWMEKGANHGRNE